ncbi:sensor histidine kinase [Virgisporangium ochraceum]|uniref:sensor histidine kinase n=1 Tax=Virgisporangium ochraceum TaxID=65505 RepID=UPI0035A25938
MQGHACAREPSSPHPFRSWRPGCGWPRGDGALHLRIEDDGAGLPTDIGTGVGLESMRSRTADIGGTVTVASGPGGGTTVVADLPLGET